MQVTAIQLSSAFPSSPLNQSSTPPHECLLPYFRFLDEESTKRISTYRRLEDAQRCLLGRLLVRYCLVRELGVGWSELNFGKTSSGRPFAIHPRLPPSFDYNVSHDSDWVVTSTASSDVGASQRKVGVDIMRIAIPWKGETVDGFVEGIEDQLTLYEKKWIKDSVNEPLKLEKVFALWTLKESYSKALGIGLGYDMTRLEFRFDTKEDSTTLSGTTFEVFEDGKKLPGWEFRLCHFGGEYWLAVALQLEVAEGNAGTASRVEVGEGVDWIRVVKMEDLMGVAEARDDAGMPS